MSLPGRRPVATKKVGAVLGLALADSDVLSVVGAGGEPVLAHADRAGVPCRLDTADPANVAYYSRFGFTVVEPALWVFRDGPPLIRMHRPAAATRGLR
jgi:hypothetical protein